MLEKVQGGGGRGGSSTERSRSPPKASCFHSSRALWQTGANVTAQGDPASQSSLLGTSVYLCQGLKGSLCLLARPYCRAVRLRQHTGAGHARPGCTHLSDEVRRHAELSAALGRAGSGARDSGVCQMPGGAGGGAAICCCVCPGTAVPCA